MGASQASFSKVLTKRLSKVVQNSEKRPSKLHRLVGSLNFLGPIVTLLDLVNFGLISMSNASLTTVTEAALPGALDDNVTFVSAMRVALNVNGAETVLAPHKIGLSFVIPNEMRSCKLAILFWDPSLNNGNGGWVEIPSQIVAAWLPDGLDRVEAWVTQTGLYILVCKG